jgi:hypothetical protein
MRVRIGPYRKNRAVKVEIEPHDTWNMDVTLAYIIHPMLVQLKETKHGAPMIDEGDVPLGMGMSEEAKARYEEIGEADGKFFDRWDWVLGEMIWAFEQYLTDLDKWGMEDEYYSRMSNGFRLFGKYYEALWD